MFSKEDDKNLNISKIHHKRKGNFGNKIVTKILGIVLAILIIGPGIVTLSSGMYEDTINGTIQPQEEGYYQGDETVVKENLSEQYTNGLVWSDEFNTMNSNSWSPRVSSPGWSFDPANVAVSNGNLVLSATNQNGIKYGGVLSKGKYNFQYGYIEIRAKVAKGNGIASGMWLAGQYHWPPEVDILEHLGKSPKDIYMTRHCSIYLDSTCDGSSFLGNTWWKYSSKRYTGVDWSLAYHNYGVEWTPSYVRWLVDGVELYRVTTGVPKEPMYITLAICANCNGGWSGYIDGTTPLPARTYFDYVRVYQRLQTPSVITVTSPNGGEHLVRGTTKTINWIPGSGTGSNIKIELLKGGIVNRVINSYTSNDGSYSWTIPSTQTLGTDYKIRITSTSNSLYKDASDNNFAIGSSSTSSTSVTVSSPNGGESWAKGTVKEIKWTYTGSPGNVKIELLKNGLYNRLIASSTTNDKSFWWPIPSGQTIGSDYKVRITSTSNSLYKDVSNNNFRIY